MNNRFLLNLGRITNEGPMYNATDKAREDVTKTLQECGYKVYNIYYQGYSPKWKAYPKFICDLIKFSLRIHFTKDVEVLIQYPGFLIGTKLMSIVLSILTRIKVILLIHDLQSLRVKGELSSKEIKLLNSADELLVHTESMANYLTNVGVTTEKKIIWLFDYYADDLIQPKKNFETPYSLVFAGNLSKSEFLRDLKTIFSPHNLYLYGLPNNIKWGTEIIYKGKFAPNEIGNISGDWGLVWDGPLLDTCSGELGEYLRFNSSHKVSLYLAAGKPIIVWSGSALAKYVKLHNIGIVVDSLHQVKSELDNISPEAYVSYLNNVACISGQLRNGGFLKNALND